MDSYQTFINGLLAIIKQVPNLINWLITPSIPVAFANTAPVAVFGSPIATIQSVIANMITNNNNLVSPFFVITTGLGVFLAVLLVLRILKSIWDAVPVL